MVITHSAIATACSTSPSEGRRVGWRQRVDADSYGCVTGWRRRSEHLVCCATCAGWRLSSPGGGHGGQSASRPDPAPGLAVVQVLSTPDRVTIVA